MKKILFWNFLLILLLSGCSPAQQAVLTPTQDGLLDEQAKTLMLEPTAPSSNASTATPEPPPTKTTTPTPLPPLPSPSPTIPAPTIIPPTPFPTLEIPSLTPGEEIVLKEIKMFSRSTGWAIGHQEDEFDRILYTQDGGQQWENRTPPLAYSAGPGSYLDITAGFFDQNTAWVIKPNPASNPSLTSYQVWTTTDAGESWTISHPLPVRMVDPYLIPREFVFGTDQHGWLRLHSSFEHMHERTYLFETRDAGRTWNSLIDPGDTALQLLHNTGMNFSHQDWGWVTKDPLGGVDPFLEQTEDGGRTWVNIPIPAPESISWSRADHYCRLENPEFSSTQAGYFLLQCAPAFEDSTQYNWREKTTYLYATTDRGETWQIEPFPSPVEQLIFLDYQTGYALGKDHYYTSDAGDSWSKIKTVTWQGDFSFINSQEGWAIARKGEDTALVHTADGGKTYQQIRPLVVR